MVRGGFGMLMAGRVPATPGFVPATPTPGVIDGDGEGDQDAEADGDGDADDEDTSLTGSASRSADDACSHAALRRTPAATTSSFTESRMLAAFAGAGTVTMRQQGGFTPPTDATTQLRATSRLHPARASRTTD